MSASSEPSCSSTYFSSAFESIRTGWFLLIIFCAFLLIYWTFCVNLSEGWLLIPFSFRLLDSAVPFVVPLFVPAFELNVLEVTVFGCTLALDETLLFPLLNSILSIPESSFYSVAYYWPAPFWPTFFAAFLDVSSPRPPSFFCLAVPACFLTVLSVKPVDLVLILCYRFVINLVFIADCFRNIIDKI